MTDRRRSAGWVTPLAALLLCAAAAAPAAARTPVQVVELEQAESEIPLELLLDVGVVIFGHGLPPEGSDPDAESKLEEKGIYRDVRRAEARIFPVHLAETLQRTGHWGAVRVIPAATDAVDLVVSGTILGSSGRELVLDVRAVDSSGAEWLARRYKSKADARGYSQEREEGVAPIDPFATVYNRIANDLLDARRRLDPERLAELRHVSQLRFAADLAPVAFGPYLESDRRGRAVPARLPAEGDPMMERVARIRERDYLLVDTFHEQYLGFYDEVVPSYGEWRAYSYEEEVALAKLRRQSRTRKILGAIAILGGILSESDNEAERAARQGAVIGGQIAIQSGIQKGQEAKIHRAAVQELAQSFDAEVSELVVQVEGQTLRLSGSAEAQYAEWRDLLREIWSSETGLTVDPDDPEGRGVAAGEESSEG